MADDTPIPFVPPDASANAPVPFVVAPPAPAAAAQPTASAQPPAAAQPSSPTAQPAAPAQPTPAQADIAHHAMLGKVASFLLGNNTSYQVDPATGKTVQVNTPRQPGQLFSSILAGTLLGAVTGSQNKSGNGLQSAGQGAAAVMGQQAQQQAAQKQQAQQDFQNQRQVDKDTQAKQLQAAQLAHLNVQNITALHSVDIAEKEHLDHLNQVNDGLLKQYEAQPGVQHPPLIVNGQDLNGQKGNGISLMQAAVKDPSLTQAPQGFHRFITPHVDYTGLEYDGKSGKWTNPDGTPADLDAHSTVTVTDIPDNIMNKMVTPGAKVLNQLIPGAGFKDSDNPSVTLGQLTALTAKSLDQQKQDKAEKLKERVANSEIALHGAEAAHANAETRKANADTNQAQDPALIDSVGTGHIAPDRMGYLLARNPQLLQAVQAKYPDFDSSKAEAYPKVYAEFTSTKQGTAGGALNSGATALGHLQELQQMNTVKSHIRGTPDYNAYMNKVDTVAPELAKFYGDPTVPAIAAIKSTLAANFPGQRDAAIRTQAKSMGDKFDSYEQSWNNAAPSKSYEAPMPNVSEKAKEARAALDPDYKARLVQQAAPASPQQNAFSLSAWQKANPQGDANAAKAAAQSQGFQVIP